MLTPGELKWLDTYNDLDVRRSRAVEQACEKVRGTLRQMQGGGVDPINGEPADRLRAAVTRYLVESEG